MWGEMRNWCGRKLQAKAFQGTGSMKTLAPRCEFILIHSNHSYSNWKVQCATHMNRGSIMLKYSLGGV